MLRSATDRKNRLIWCRMLFSRARAGRGVRPNDSAPRRKGTPSDAPAIRFAREFLGKSPGFFHARKDTKRKADRLSEKEN